LLLIQSPKASPANPPTIPPITVPIPGAEVTLNQNDLLTDARSQKEALLTQLRETLNEVGRQKQLEKLAANSENLLKVLNDVPMGLYIF
jgi:hypothetical protein